MRITKFLTQNRRDFTAVFACEHCGLEDERGGYDDANFHENVIPDMECAFCGKKAPEDFRPFAAKYHADTVV